jgi:hypothetical protein
MPDLESLQHDHVLLMELLESRRTVTTETLPAGLRILWTIYLTILEDAVTTLNSLISYLSPKL